MQRLYPAQSESTISGGSLYEWLAWQTQATRPFVALNFVSSLDGRVTLNGSAAGIGSRTDHAAMMALRINADALLYGAGTLRADPVGKGVPDHLEPIRIAHGLAAQPLMVVLTSSGELPLERGFFAERERAIVFVADATPPEVRARLSTHAQVYTVGERMPDPRAALELLRTRYGVRHVLSEGGPRLFTALLAQGLADELFLTLAPKFLGGEGLTLTDGPAFLKAQVLRLISLYEHESELFLRYAINSPGL